MIEKLRWKIAAKFMKKAADLIVNKSYHDGLRFMKLSLAIVPDMEFVRRYAKELRALAEESKGS